MSVTQFMSFFVNAIAELENQPLDYICDVIKTAKPSEMFVLDATVLFIICYLNHYEARSSDGCNKNFQLPIAIDPRQKHVSASLDFAVHLLGRLSNGHALLIEGLLKNNDLDIGDLLDALVHSQFSNENELLNRMQNLIKPFLQ